MIRYAWILHACCRPLQQTCMKYYNIKAFPVGGNGVKRDFKVVSACLDTQEETRSEPQRVSHPTEFVCECSPTGS